MNLVIQQRGMTLGVHDGSYQARSRDGEKMIPPGPVRSIALHPGTKITHEAVLVAMNHETDILFMDHRGFPIARVWSPKFGSIATIRKHQVLFARSPDAVTWVKGMLLRKIDNQLAILSMLPAWDSLHGQELQADEIAVGKIRGYFEETTSAQLEEVAGKFRNLEARASKRYWQAISRALPDAYRYSKRSQHPAEDMFNCLLNYAYGMLYGIVEGALIQAGLDPYLGIFHRDEYNRPSLAFDFIEPFRVWADYVVIKLCMDQVIFREFFDIQPGSFLLNASGKQVLIPTMNEYLNEVVTQQGLARSRREHIQREAHQFATTLKSPFLSFNETTEAP